ncbi:MAG TPA: hypothetical protein VK890_11250, partial [Bacteroidia bacterium]|nr:hypothetical protein [Bacteroidia bacterium]
MKYQRFVFAAGILIFSTVILSIACKKDTTTTTTTTIPPPGVQLVFIFKFDSTQVRLDNLGNPSTVPAGHSALSPVFNLMSSHYIELAPTSTTQLGYGDVLYRAPEVGSGTNLAINFSKCVAVGAGVPFYTCPLDSVKPGTYQW